MYHSFRRYEKGRKDRTSTFLPTSFVKREHLAGPAKFRHAGRLTGSHPVLFILVYWQKADPSMVWCSGTFVCGSYSTSHTHGMSSCCFLQCSGILALWDPSDWSMRPLRSTPSLQCYDKFSACSPSPQAKLLECHLHDLLSKWQVWHAWASWLPHEQI